MTSFSLLLRIHDVLYKARAEVWPVIKVSFASFARRQAVVYAMNILQKTKHGATVALIDLLFGPGEFLRHFSIRLEHFHSFS